MQRLLTRRAVLRFGLVGLCSAAPIRYGVSQTPTPIVIDVRRNMQFGTIASDIDFSGTVVIDPATQAKSTAGGVFDFGGRHRTANFRINGDSRAYVIVTLPSQITLQNQGGSGTVIVNNFTMNKTNPVRLSNSGRKTVRVGATLNVPAGQNAGDYDVDFTFTANYL